MRDTTGTRLWAAVLLHASVHLAALYAATWAVAALTACAWPSAGTRVPTWLWPLTAAVASVFTVLDYYAGRAHRAGHPARPWTGVGATVLGMTTLIALALSWDARLSSSTLLAFVGLVLLAHGLRRLLPASLAGFTAQPLQPAAPWLLSTVLLMAVTLLHLVLGRPEHAERLANWALGCLALGVSLAVLEALLPPARMPQPMRRLGSWLRPAGLGVLLLVASAVLLKADQPPLLLRGAFPAVAAYLQPRVAASDVVVTQAISVGLACYGVQAAHQAELPAEGDLLALAATLVAGRQRAYFVYPAADGRERHAEHLALELAGDLLETRPGDVTVEAYTIQPWLGLVAAPALHADFGVLRVLSVNYQPAARSGNVLGLTLALALNEQRGRDYVAKLVLLDGAGEQAATLDADLFDSAGQPTSIWEIGHSVTGSYLLPVPLGTAPGLYRLAVGFYAAADYGSLVLVDRPGLGANLLLPVAEIEIERSPNDALDPYATLAALDLTPADTAWGSIRLLKLRPVSGTILPGNSLPLLFLWQALEDAPPAQPLWLQFRAGSQVSGRIALSPGGEYPTRRWQRNEQVLQRVNLRVPPESAAGQLTVELAANDQALVTLGTVMVAPVERSFTPPAASHPVDFPFGDVAALVGYDLVEAAAPAGQLSVTLYWQALNLAPLPAHYKVFVHALSASGELLAQSDAEPAGWTRPTTSWIEGEYIADTHTLIVPADYSGPISLRLGLYDAATLTRVAVAGGDFILLTDAHTFPPR